VTAGGASSAGDGRSPKGGAYGRPLPWRTLAIFLVPFAALAAATGLQRWFEGPAPTGDALLRWLLFASVTGLLIGGVAGLIFGRTRAERYGWTLLGVVGPWLVTIAATGVLHGAHAIQERWALHELRACHASGRALCRQAEFRGACAAAVSRDPALRDAAWRSLGVPLRKSCDQNRCEARWSYDGPWDVEDEAHKQVCSVITDARGLGGRWLILAGEEP
jgi:hypothetical protein